MTVGLAVSLAVVLALLQWVVMQENNSGHPRDFPGIPESWPAYHSEWNTTKTLYHAAYDDCIVLLTKEGTDTEDISLESLLKCTSERGWDRDEVTAKNFTYVTVPSDFTAGLEDQRCFLTLFVRNFTDEPDYFSMRMSCWDNTDGFRFTAP